MKKYVIALILSVLCLQNEARADEPSLIDLFGEEAGKQQATDSRKMPEAVSNKTQSVSSEEKVDDEGMFSFLNFSFLRNKEKAKEFTRKDDEPQESYEERMTRLANEGDVDACLSLGYMYLYGENGLEQDKAKAFEYYSKAADLGDKVAMNNLGSLYFSGIGTNKNLRKAIKLFDEAAKLGNNEAAVNLAFIYLTSGTKNDANLRSTVVKLFNQAAEGDNITAQYMLGMIYYNGYGINKNEDKAFHLLKKAATKYDEAQYQLALRYMNAEGTPRNYGNAVKSLVKAAGQGHIPSMLWLGDILAAGTSYPKNEYQAYVWYNIASVYDAKAAASKRDQLENKLKIEEILQAQSTAEGYVPHPSPITEYVRKTFGVNLADYVAVETPSQPKK